MQMHTCIYPSMHEVFVDLFINNKKQSQRKQCHQIKSQITSCFQMMAMDGDDDGDAMLRIEPGASHTLGKY